MNFDEQSEGRITNERKQLINEQNDLTKEIDNFEAMFSNFLFIHSSLK